MSTVTIVKTSMNPDHRACLKRLVRRKTQPAISSGTDGGTETELIGRLVEEGMGRHTCLEAFDEAFTVRMQ